MDRSKVTNSFLLNDISAIWAGDRTHKLSILCQLFKLLHLYINDYIHSLKLQCSVVNVPDFSAFIAVSLVTKVY